MSTAPPMLLTPAALLDAAAVLGVDVKQPKQLHLLAAARAYLELPLPGKWARTLDSRNNKLTYVDARSNRVSSAHPQLCQYEHLVSRLTAMVPEDYAQRTCMELRHADGTSYVHDFGPRPATGSQQKQAASQVPSSPPAPQAAQLPAQPAEEVVTSAPEASVEQPLAAAEGAADADTEASQEAAAMPLLEAPEAAAATAAAAEVAPSVANEGAEAAPQPASDSAAAAAEVAQQPSEQAKAEGNAQQQPEQPEATTTTGSETQQLDQLAAPSEVQAQQQPLEQPEAAGTTDADLRSLQAAPKLEPAAQPSAQLLGRAQASTISSWLPPPERMILPVPSAMLEVFGLINSAEPQSLSDTGVRAGVHRLRYYSWWYEDIESTDLTFRVNADSVVGGGLRKRYVTLDYHLGSGTFSLHSANEDQELHMDHVPVVTKAGGPVEIWDLHVGATLSVLGKKLTLHKADLETSLWNDSHAARLRLLKTELLAELQKYKPRAHSAALVCDRGDRVGAGGLSLQHIVEQIRTLLADLHKYRPAKVEQYRAKIQIQV